MAAPRIVTRALDVRASAWLSILLVSGCVVLLDALHAFQWRGPYGGLRAAIAVLLAGVCVSALIFSRRIRLSLPDQGLVARALALITGLAVAIYGGLWIWAVVHTAVSGDTQSDGTQNTYKAIVLLGRGQNPYSHDVMIDPGYYFRLLATLATKEHCLAEPLPTDLSSIRTGNWRTANLTSLEAPLPVISGAPDCRILKLGFSSLGYKYGPVLLALNWPFVQLFGLAGIFVAQGFLVAATMLLLGLFARHRAPKSLLLQVVPLFILVVPVHLAISGVLHGTSDVTATLFAFGAFACFQTARPRLACTLLACSIATKLLPGLLLTPMLLSVSRRHWGWFIAPLACAYVPFVVWDPIGVLNNVVLFNTWRETTPTALAHFLPGSLRLGLTLLGAVVILAGAVVAQREKWSYESTLQYVLIAMTAVLVSGPIFINNYVLWLLPFIGLAIAAALERAKGAAAVRTHARGVDGAT